MAQQHQQFDHSSLYPPPPPGQPQLQPQQQQPPQQQIYSAPSTPTSAQDFEDTEQPQRWTEQYQDSPQQVHLEMPHHIVPSQREPSPAGHDLTPIRLHPVQESSEGNSGAEMSGQLTAARPPMRPTSLVVPARPARTLGHLPEGSHPGGDASIGLPSSSGDLISFPESSSSSSVLKQSTMKQSHRVSPYPPRQSHVGATEQTDSSAATTQRGSGIPRPISQQQPRQRRTTQPVQYRFQEYNPPGTSQSPQGRPAASSLSPPSHDASSPAPVTTSPHATLRPTFSPIPPLQSPPPIPATSTLLHPHAPTPPPPQQLPILPVPPQSQLPRMLLTTDIHYDQPTQTLIAMLEVPGVRSQDVQVTLSTSMYNCVRQVKVVGRSWPVLPQRGEGTGIPIQRERRFGEFSRVFPVHPLMSAGDIDAEIQNGVLTLRMKCGPPATSEDEKVIPIR